MSTGIYCIENKINGKKYIGQTSRNIEDRWKQHIKELNGNYHGNHHLQGSWNKHKQDNFEFSVIEECAEVDLNDREQYWIDFYETIKKNTGYNLCGVKPRAEMRDETRKKLSDTKVGESNPMYGIPSPMAGRNHSEISRTKMSIAKRGNNYRVVGINHPLYGKKLSDDHKEKIKNNSARLSGEDHPRVQITEEIAKEIVDLLLDNRTVLDIANIYGISNNIVFNIKYKHTWKHLTDNICFYNITANASKSITEETALEIIKRIESGDRPIDISNELNVSKAIVHHIKSKKRWKHVWEQYYNQLKDAI